MTVQTDGLFRCIKEAGREIRCATADYSVYQKEGTANFVTDCDISTQRFLESELKRIYPDAVFIAEEQENSMELLQSDCCFIIDPIDGTTNFIHSLHHSAISVALVSHGQVMQGAIYNPYSDELFFAERGKGAFLNGEKITVSDRTFETALAVFGTSPYYKGELSDRTFRAAHRLFDSCSDVRRSGSAALDLAELSAGRFDLYFEYRISPWDFAAGSLIVTEAGGIITDTHGSAISLRTVSGVVAAAPGLHRQLLSIVMEEEKKENLKWD